MRGERTVSGHARGVVALVVAVLAISTIAGSCSFFGSFASEHWVSPTGNDGATGDEASPWRSIDTALTRAAPGDTIHITPGVYYERVIMTRSGEDGSPIRIVGYDGAVLDGSQDESEPDSEYYWGGLLELRGASHVEITGLSVRATRGSAIFVREDATNVTITNNHTINTARSGIGVWGATNVVVSDNVIETAGYAGDGAGIQLVDVVAFEARGNTVTTVGSADHPEDGISVARDSSDGTVAENTISAVQGRAIVLESWEAGTISGVSLRDNNVSASGIGVEIHPALGGTIEQVSVGGTTVVSCGDAYLINNMGVETGVPGTVREIDVSSNHAEECETALRLMLMSGSSVGAITLENTIAENITDHGCLVSLSGSAEPPLIEALAIVNNTFFNTNSNGGYGAALEISSYVDASSKITVANNIFAASNVRSVVVDLDNPGTVTVDHNLFTEASFGAAGETHGTNALETSATIFTDSAAGDFTLVAGSPAIDAGRSTDAPDVDYLGTVRPQGSAVDMGAYEYAP
ncbi:MAG: right-handed parallel beta-helix repeat-containing protein [Spirochaetota bacterium]